MSKTVQNECNSISSISENDFHKKVKTVLFVSTMERIMKCLKLHSWYFVWYTAAYYYSGNFLIFVEHIPAPFRFDLK